MAASDPHGELTATERARLAQGFHAEVAGELIARGRPDLAGWVREQIWDFDGAFAAYRTARRPVDALRCALESGKASALDEILGAIEAEAAPQVVDAAIAVLESRRRHMEVARLLALRESGPQRRADALVRAGDRLGAARVLADTGHSRDALQVLAPDRDGGASPAVQALAARLAWDLGDAEGAARFAQAALRAGGSDADTVVLLARALGTLGHDLAAQMVLGERTDETNDAGVPGRYRVTGLRPSGLAGAAYVGFDRVTLQEVEIHLMLADQPDIGPVDPQVVTAIERFAAVAEAAAAIGHPAIRPVLRIEPHAGLVVMPRAEGPDLRSMIRPPGMLSTLSRARGLVAFLAEGLAAAHARGMVHGWMLPSQIVCDAIGRPMLGPFGAHHLAGLTATHTGGLEELMAITAPELRSGRSPTVATDLYALGSLLVALLTGTLRTKSIDDIARDGELPVHQSAPPELTLARALLAVDPDARPSIHAVLATLRAPVADVRDLGSGAAAESGARPVARDRPTRPQARGVEISVADAWSEDRLDALCSAANPWLQPILDREERSLVLAPWPKGSRSLEGADLPNWRKLLPDEALEFDDDELSAAVAERLRPSSLVRTPSGQWMIALDDLLSR